MSISKPDIIHQQKSSDWIISYHFPKDRGEKIMSTSKTFEHFETTTSHDFHLTVHHPIPTSIRPPKQPTTLAVGCTLEYGDVKTLKMYTP